MGIDVSRATTQRNIRAALPTVVLCGRAVTGKSTLAARLASAASLERLRTVEQPRTTDERRRADLALLRALDRPSVVESAALPHLLPVDNHALIVQLTASTPVRAQRLRSREPAMSESEAHHLLELTDATNHGQLRTSWGIDVAGQGHRWRADLVLGCPHSRVCKDETGCTTIVAELLTAAYRAYTHYLTGQAPDALARFTALRRQHPRHVRRCGPALLGPVPEFTAAAWRTRMHTELERRAGVL